MSTGGRANSATAPLSLDTIYCEAIDLRSPEAPAVYAAQACGADDDLCNGPTGAWSSPPIFFGRPAGGLG